MIQKMFSLVSQSFGDIILPTFCLVCKDSIGSESSLCSVCLQAVRPITTITLSINRTNYMPVCAVTAYEDPLKRLILAKQSTSQVGIARALGDLLWQMSVVAQWNFDVVVPVPLHWSRYAWRGYNQAAEIGLSIAARSGRPLVYGLKRVRRTTFQAELSYHERQENVSDVFVLTRHAKKLSGARILLVDDVMTSGATLKGAAKALLATNPATISAAVVCRVLL